MRLPQQTTLNAAAAQQLLTYLTEKWTEVGLLCPSRAGEKRAPFPPIRGYKGTSTPYELEVQMRNTWAVSSSRMKDGGQLLPGLATLMEEAVERQVEITGDQNVYLYEVHGLRQSAETTGGSTWKAHKDLHQPGNPRSHLTLPSESTPCGLALTNGTLCGQESNMPSLLCSTLRTKGRPLFRWRC